MWTGKVMWQMIRNLPCYSEGLAQQDLLNGVDMGHGSKRGQRWVGLLPACASERGLGLSLRWGGLGNEQLVWGILSPGCAPSPGPLPSISWVTWVLRAEVASSSHPEVFRKGEEYAFFSGHGLVRASPAILFLAYSLPAEFVRSLSLSSSTRTLLSFIWQ